MRYLRFSVFLSALVVATAIFLPYIQAGVGGMAFGKQSTLPLYNAVSNYGFIENAVAKTEAAPSVRIADALLSRLGRSALPFSKHLAEARSALEDVREVREQAEVETIGAILRTTGLVFLALLAIIAWLMLKSISRREVSRRRSYWVAGLMTIVGVGSMALFLGVREALALANEEIGAAILSLGIGAYLMAIAGVIGCVAALAMAVLDRQAEKRSSLSSE